MFVVEQLIAEGATVQAYDPAARETAAIAPPRPRASRPMRTRPPPARRSSRCSPSGTSSAGSTSAGCTRRWQRRTPSSTPATSSTRRRCDGAASRTRASAADAARRRHRRRRVPRLPPLPRAARARLGRWSRSTTSRPVSSPTSTTCSIAPTSSSSSTTSSTASPSTGPVSAVLHFASAASPPAYLARPIATLEVGSIGTQHALELARKHDGARLLLASTSEVYGDPDRSPQHESYWGNVNPVGPRSVYDEAKRFGEAITMAYHRTYGIDTKIARIFNTYGPFLRPEDGRVDVELPRPGDRRSPAHGVRRRLPDAVVLLRRRPRRRAPGPARVVAPRADEPRQPQRADHARARRTRCSSSPARTRRSSSRRCPRTIPTSAVPTSPSPSRSSVGDPRSISAKVSPARTTGTGGVVTRA